MAARRGTSRDRRAAALGAAPPWALVATLVACRPAAADPHRELPGSSTTADPSMGPGSADTGTTTGTGPDVLETDSHPGYPSPDCATLLLPGPPSDVAATPRPDRDAESLALSLDPTRTAAPQARYEVVAADLAVLRALDPTLADVHVGCPFPNGIAFWFFDDEDVNQAIFADDYHACHNDWFHLRAVTRIDGLAVAIELDGVYGEPVAQAYAALAGLGNQEPHWFPPDAWPVPWDGGAGCEPVEGGIELTATLLPDGTLDQRDYRFERADGSTVVWRITPTEPPQEVR
jgi:hypothetical protein